MTTPLISIIIPAHNEGENIVKSLKRINSQSFKDIETIVVANGCNDNTYELAKPFATRVIKTPIANLPYAKNLGARKAKGNYLAFIDADIEPQKSLLKKSLTKIKKDCVGVICHLKTYGGDPFGDAIFNFIDNHILIHGLVTIPRGYLMIPKSLFEKMHKKDNIFREDLQLGEDLDMGNKLKHYGKIEVIDSLNKTFARRYIDYGYIRIMFEYAKAYFNSLFGTRMKTFYPEHKK